MFILSILVAEQQLQIQKHGKTNKVMHSFPVQSPNITVEPLSSDPKSDDFLAFRLVNLTTKKELDRYRTDDIVQMRRFIASLGSSGFGVYTSKPPPTIEAEEAFWAGIAPPKVHKTAQQYEELLASLPTEFYFSKKPSGITVTISAGAMPAPFAKPFPLYDPQIPLAPLKRRQWHDTFRPEVGPAIYVPISMGYGEEVGLLIGQQAVWDPVLKACVVLDHNTKQYINKDLRKPFKYPKKVAQSKVRFGDMRAAPDFKYNYSICNDPHVIKAASDRAKLKIKPHGFVLDASGVKGMHGPSGRSAAPGIDGRPGDCGKSKGARGRNGNCGAPGNPGTEGIDGKPGTNASNVTLFLEGGASNFKVSGSYTFAANLGGDGNEEVLFVNCRGGDGGEGGNGSNGGTGGGGGDGGDGAPGKKGRDNPGGGWGEDGGRGGDGGTGGSGGPGGCGGIGGKGGNAGAGGTCVICAADPKLLMLVEVNALNGEAGKGGTGGKGGEGGLGGDGGHGGIGGAGGIGYRIERSRDGTKEYHYTMNGSQGPSGRGGECGSNGQRGRDASSGSKGKQAPVGGIAWVVYSMQGGVLQQAGTRYDIEVKNYEVIDENNDGVFEPNERIAVSEVLVTNVGGLTLPAGAEVTMQKTDSNTVNFEPIRFKLPEIKSQGSFKVPITFYGRINDQPPPLKPGPLKANFTFESRVDLLGRCFSNSFRKPHSRPLPVQYPVKLKQLRCNENVGRGEVTIITVQIENISSKPYGSCEGAAGKVGVQVHMDARLIPVAYGSYKDEKLPYIVTYDPNKRDSLYIDVSRILPKETLTMHLAVQIDSEAELFDRCQWQADLCLRGKVIEYNFEKIRISPIYVQREPRGDILMVTGPDISLAAFNLWQRMFEILGVTVDYWDTARHQGFSEDSSTKSCHTAAWVGHYHGRLILYPYCHLPFLRGSHIIHHFHGEQAERPDLNSSMVLLMKPSQLRPVKVQNRFQDRGDVPILQHLASIDESLPLPKEGYGGKHVTSPTSDKSFLKWEQQTLEQKEKENPSHGVTVFRRQSSIESVGAFKYSYGEVDLRRCPLKRSCKFVAVDGAGGGIAQIGVDDMNVSPSNLNQVPLASNFGQAFLFTLYGLPISTKLSLIKGIEAAGGIPQILFSLPNGFLLSLAQISTICLSYEIADEVLACSKTLVRANEVLADITANKSAYASKAELMLQLIDLVDKELQERKKRADNPIVTQAAKEAKKLLGKIQQVIRESGRRSSKAKQPILPGFTILQDTLHTHRSHQHMVKDDRWNLVTS